jgi:hypothetical protein
MTDRREVTNRPEPGGLPAGSVTTSTLADGAVTLGKLPSAVVASLSTTFTNPTPADSDGFGCAVAAVGTDKAIIGAFQDSTGATVAGAAYLFSLESYVPGLISAGVVDHAITAADLDPSIGVWSKSGTNVY